MKILRNAVIVVVLFSLLIFAGFLFFEKTSKEYELPERHTLFERLERWQNAVRVLGDYTVELPFLVPTDGEEVSAATIDFEFMGKTHSIRPQVNYRVYHGAVALDRDRLWRDLWPRVRPDEIQLLVDYYNFLTLEPQMNHAIESVVEQLRAIRDERNLSNCEYIELIVRYVQSIPYCHVHGSPNRPDWVLGCPRMPIQVLVDGTGDCDETSMLLAALLYREGHEVSLLFFEDENHVAVGLSVEGDGFKNTGYVLIETIIVIPISEVPEELAGGVIIESIPFVLTIGNR